MDYEIVRSTTKHDPVATTTAQSTCCRNDDDNAGVNEITYNSDDLGNTHLIVSRAYSNII
jgi:hypothetical protein